MVSAHEPWCCRSPESQCAKAGGCSGSCNCGAREDECRPVTLPSGERIIVRGSGQPDAGTAAMLGEVVAAARRHREQTHRPARTPRRCGRAWTLPGARRGCRCGRCPR